MSATRAILRRQAAGHLLAPAPSLFVTEDYRPIRIAPGSGAYPGQILVPEWDSNRAIKEGLKVSSHLATMIGQVAELAASVPWYRYDVKKSGSEERGDPIEWIEFPRRDGKISRFQMMEEAHHHAFLAGVALFGVLWEGGSRFRLRPAELRCENPHGCHPIPDRLKHIAAYQWDDTAIGGLRYWDADDIVHVVGRPDPSNPYWGWSILQALAPIVDAHREALRLNLLRFKRHGAPGTIIMDEDVSTPLERKELEDDLNSRADKYFGGFMVLAGMSQKVAPIHTLTEVQLGITKVMAFHRDECAIAIGLHPSLFTGEHSTYENLRSARRARWQVAVMRNARFADAFTTRMVPRAERDRWYIAPDYSEIEELQDLAGQIKNVGDMVQLCRIAVNQAIAVAHLPVPPQEGGDRPLVEGGLVPAGDAAEGLLTE